MNRGILAISFCITACAIGWITVQETPYLRLSRAIELFGTIVREINDQYVQPIEPDELVNEAIEHMLSKLDPYTEFYREEQTADLDFLLQGKYIGVGIRLATLDSVLTVVGLTEGTSAHREGVRIGDVVLAIDSIAVTPAIAQEARKYLRGAVGTTVRLRLLRGTDTFDVRLTREEIVVRNVMYAGIIEGGIGVVRLDRFSRRAPEEFRSALDSLRSVHQLRGLIVDIRDNPGGLLEAAVSIAEMFLRPGDTIVITKNRNGSNQRVYTARSMPYTDTTIPVVVLVNSHSASASEILAGALQDNDRAVVVGDTTLGKGLVQTVVTLPYNAALKLTTARYYTPSGRSIQQVHRFCPDCWIHRGLDTEQQKTFRTLKYRRAIVSGAGIVPDVVLESADRDSVPPAIGRTAIVNFATHYTSRLRSAPAAFNQAQLLSAFVRYVEQSQSASSSVLGKVQRLADQARVDEWGQRSVQHIERLAQLLRAERSRLVYEHGRAIVAALEQEIRNRFLTDRQIAMQQEPSDAVVVAAAEILRSSSYRKFFMTAHGTDR